MKRRLSALGLLMVLAAAPALGQGCAMCYSSAANATKDGQRAISRAVLVLLTPPLSVMSLGIVLAVRYSKKRDRDTEEEEVTTGYPEEQ